VLPREALGPDPQQLFQVPLDELEEGRLGWHGPSEAAFGSP
jgi:hypothetical protein